MGTLLPSEWWTYGLSDLLLFSPATYLRLFELHNASAWPMPVLSLGSLALCLLLLRQPSAGRWRVVAGLLALHWLWVAWSFHVQHYASINWAATGFAAAFALQALLLLSDLWRAAASPWPMPAAGPRRAALALCLLAGYAYPALPLLSGRPWMQAEVFGLAPDPTALATLALLAWSGRRPITGLAALPLLWGLLSSISLWVMALRTPALILGAGLLAAVATLVWAARSGPAGSAQGAVKP